MDLSQKMWIQNQQSQSDSVILDVRTPEEYQSRSYSKCKVDQYSKPS
jgi:rhodanese-related sulfurtransferase